MTAQSLSSQSLPARSTGDPSSLRLAFLYLRRNRQLAIGLAILIFFILFSTIGMLLVDKMPPMRSARRPARRLRVPISLARTDKGATCLRLPSLASGKPYASVLSPV